MYGGMRKANKVDKLRVKREDDSFSPGLETLLYIYVFCVCVNLYSPIS